MLDSKERDLLLKHSQETIVKSNTATGLLLYVYDENDPPTV